MALTNKTKEGIFLALTKIHRDILNHKEIAWFKEFLAVGVSTNIASMVKQTLIKMSVIKVSGRGNNSTYSWNKSMTIPNPQLVEGILIKAKEYNITVRPSNTKSVAKPKESIRHPKITYTYYSSVSCMSYSVELPDSCISSTIG